MRVTFNALAEAELVEAIDYYEHERDGLGGAFLTEIRRTTGAIVAFPDAGTSIRGAVRRRLCHRFPYAVLYERRGEEIRILAVMNQRRRPSFWFGRT